MGGWSSYKEGLLSLIAHPAVSEYFEGATRVGLIRMLERRSDLLESFDRCQSLVHGDFRPDNALVSNDSLVGVLDWEFAHSGCFFMDIGNLMRSNREYEERSRE